MSVSLSTDIITFIHFAFLFNRKKQHEHTFTQFIFGKQTLLGYTTKQILAVDIAVCVHNQCLVKSSEERKFLVTKSPGNESSSERKVQGMKVPRNFRSPGTKVPENEKALE